MPGAHKATAGCRSRRRPPQPRRPRRSGPSAGHRARRHPGQHRARADQLRAKDPGLGRRSAGWHYVNIAEDNCHYEAPKHCKSGNCIVEALKAQSAILGDRSLTDGERLQALKFVVHLVGDIHQPMHAGYAHDKGGNDFQLQFGNRGTNLHSLWDSGMLNARKLDDAGYLPVLQSQRAPKLARQSNPQRDPQTWAEASCRISMQAGVYPATRKIGDEYTERYRPLAEAQLRLAGENRRSC